MEFLKNFFFFAILATMFAVRPVMAEELTIISLDDEVNITSHQEKILRDLSKEETLTMEISFHNEFPSRTPYFVANIRLAIKKYWEIRIREISETSAFEAATRAILKVRSWREIYPAEK